MVRYVCTVKWVSKEGVTKFLREGGKFQGIFEMSFPFFKYKKSSCLLPYNISRKSEFWSNWCPFFGSSMGILMRFPCYVMRLYLFCACFIERYPPTGFSRPLFFYFILWFVSDLGMTIYRTQSLVHIIRVRVHAGVLFRQFWLNRFLTF